MNEQPTVERTERILTLDLSIKRTGWAGIQPDGYVLSGATEFRTPKGAAPAIRFQQFRTALDELLSGFSPDRVVIEDVVCRHQGAVQDALIGLRTRVLEACAIRNIPCETIHPNTIKKCTTGDGAAEKSDMRRWADEKFAQYDPRLDFEANDADEADALAILWVWMNCQAELTAVADRRSDNRAKKRMKDKAERAAGRATITQRRAAKTAKRQAKSRV